MCQYASFVLTRDKVFWSRTSDSHTGICEEAGLHEDGAHGPNVLKVEIVPRRATITDFYDFAQWDYRIDQDILPSWHDAPADRERALAALAALVRVRVYAHSCQNLTTLEVPAATTVDASGCPKLTTLEVAPGATVYR